ncbi:hypothetical protein N431DRAFT_548257 [Stipitochalara longipes BDJ]|nr:hypothetical protein N431DRAFT_548257 [Stipitochalara longipes BDJ]
MVSSSLYFVSVLGFALRATAQCVTAGYVPCLVPGATTPVAPEPITPYGGSTPYSSFGSGFWSSVSGVATDPIQFGGDSRRDLEARSPLDDAYVEGAGIEKRQNSLCCRPSPVECLYADGVPFCYNPSTTRLYFSDGSVAYLSNDTFYGSDGTFIDYKNGVYEYPNGTVVDFTPDSSAATSSAGGSQPTGTGVVGSTKGSATVTHITATATGSSSGSTGSSAKNAASGVAATWQEMLLAVLGVVVAVF